MSKKKLRGFIKSRHFIERQNERNVSDKDVMRAIIHGDLTENEDGQNFVLGNLKVTVDFAHEILITVHPGHPETRAKKLLTKEDARKLRLLIEEHKTSDLEKAEYETNDFLRYVKDNAIKKI
jgi:hypothetical protein